MKVDVYALAQLILDSKPAPLPVVHQAKYRPGDAIAQYRKARGMSRQALADVSGLAINTIERIEKTNRASWASMTTLLDTLGVDLVFVTD